MSRIEMQVSIASDSFDYQVGDVLELGAVYRVPMDGEPGEVPATVGLQWVSVGHASAIHDDVRTETAMLARPKGRRIK